MLIVFGREMGERSENSCLLGNTLVFLLRGVHHITTYDIRFEKTIYCDNIIIKSLCTVIGFNIILSSVKLERRFSIVEIASE